MTLPLHNAPVEPLKHLYQKGKLGKNMGHGKREVDVTGPQIVYRKAGPQKKDKYDCEAECPQRETAEALGVSESTVKRGWAMAKAWLHRELTR